MKPYYEYADKVLNGSIVVGEYIKLACERFLNDLQREDLEFREEKVDLAIQFISTLTLTQVSILESLLYWKDGSSS